MLSVQILTEPGSVTMTNDDAETAKLFWLTKLFVPKSACAVIELSA